MEEDEKKKQEEIITKYVSYTPDLCVLGAYCAYIAGNENLTAVS